jgi:hypothetical protein
VRSCEKKKRWRTRPRYSFAKKSRFDLGKRTRGRNVTVSDREQVRALVVEAVAQKARQHTACEMVGVVARPLQRWQRQETIEDGRRGPRTAPRNTLSPHDQLVAVAVRPEFVMRVRIDRPTGRPRRIPAPSRSVLRAKAEHLRRPRIRTRAYEVTAPGRFQRGYSVCATLHSWPILLFVFICRRVLPQGRGRGSACRGIPGALLAVTRHDLP